MEEKSLLERSRTQEEAEEDTDSPGTERRDVQPGPSSAPPVNPGVVGLPASSSYASGEGSVNHKFDVFISHRGPDTKSTLAYHLYDLLRDRGVEAFLDKEELQSGELFPEAIKKAIASSKVDVCILSSGFPESVWCLKELVIMLHKYERGLSTLIPIFYDGEPAEVRHLKGAFGQGFVNLQSKGRKSSEDIEQWRLALRRIADISGYQGKGELAMTIVQRICESLHTGRLDTPKNVITRENDLHSTIHGIMICRNNKFIGHNNKFGVTLVEISGIGGIGKTTFAKELYNQIHTEYDKYCFIEDVNGLVEKHNVHEVHRQILSKLFRDHQRDLTEAKKLLKQKLGNAEILVVIDNIHSKIPLSTVFIEDDVFLNPRSTIIVTSREEGVVKYDSGVQGFCQNLIALKMEKLDFKTSKKIFCNHAFGGINNVEDEFNELTEKIVKKCDGMPLALSVLGKHVYNQNFKFWRSLWSSMTDCLHPDVKQILKFSYDNLTSDLEKCLFLDIATFFRWEKEEILLEIRCQSHDEHGELQVQYALESLKRNLLIDVSKDGILQMHDVLVDLGRSIVKDENLYPGHRSRVWFPSNVRSMLSNEQGTEKVKALTLVSEGSPVLDEGQLPWCTDVFSKLSSLEILILQGDCIEGDLSKLSRTLLWLRWADFPYHTIPLNLYIRRLKVLHVAGENLIELWAHLQKEAPSKLRQLSICHCTKLERLPEAIGRLRLLSSIILDECKSLKFMPESFGELKGLKDLQLWRCHALEGLPESFGGLRSLISLTMKYCDAMVSLPESFGELAELKCLDITCCNGLERLPQSFQCLTSLCDVTVSDCRKIRLSPEQFQELQPRAQGGWQLSTNLDDDMEVADCWFARISNAERPNFDFWKNYSIWHSQVPQRHNLRWLLREVVQHIQMKEKRYLDSINNNNDTGASQVSLEFMDIHFIEAAGNMTFPCKVTHLSLQDFWNLRELPQFVGNNRYMTELHLIDCYSLQKLPESLGSLSCLEELFLRWCCNLQKLPDTIGNLPCLRNLTVVGCLALKRFPFSFRNLSCLERLHVAQCWMVEVIDIQGLTNLTHLTVRGCVNLRSIVGLSDCGKLEMLEIEGCMNLKSIVGLSDICKLSYLTIGGCISLRDMSLTVGGFASFNSLAWLIIDGCYRLRFSENIVQCLPPNLRFCRLSDNHNLVYRQNLFHTEEGDEEDAEMLNAKTSPLFFATMKERLIRSSLDKPSFSIHNLEQHTHVPSLPFIVHAMAVCYVSGVYADDFPDHIPLPETGFELHEIGIGNFRRFDFGEEIHVDVRGVTQYNFRQHFERGDFDLNVHVSEDANRHFNGVPYPSYEAILKEGCIIFLNGGGREQSKTLASEIRNIFHSELRNQHLMSRAWTELPSQLRIHDFSALDIAGCQITKISRHCNTCIMEEETGLTWKIRRCIFMDDHSLLLQQPKHRKHSFLAYPGVDRDLEETVANLYEMSISILMKGMVIHSRKLQQISPKTEEEICFPLNTLLQSRGFHSTSETMHRLSLFMVKNLKAKSNNIEFKEG